MLDCRQVYCGSLTAHLVESEDPDFKFVAAWIGDGAPWYCLPFGDRPTYCLVAVDETRLLAFSREEEPRHQLALLDVANRKVANVAADADFQFARWFVVDADRDRLLLPLTPRLRCWRLSDFAELWSKPLDRGGARHVAAAIRSDGALVLKSRDDSPPPIVRVYSLDGDLIGSHGDGRYQGERALSANGRWLTRQHRGSVLLTTESGALIESLPDPRQLSDAAAAEWLRAIHLHGVQEIWSAAPLELLARVPVRSAPLLELLHPTEDKRTMLIWLGRALLENPYASWSPSERADLLNIEFALGRSLAMVAGTIVAWEGDDPSFVVEFPDETLRRVRLDGEVTELQPGGPKPSGFIPGHVSKGARDYVRARTRPDFSIAAAPLAERDRFTMHWGVGPSTEDYGWLHQAVRVNGRSTVWRWSQGLQVSEIFLDERDRDSDPYSIESMVFDFTNWARSKAFLIPGEFPQEAFWLSSLAVYVGQVNDGGHGQFLGNCGWQPDMVGACERALAAIGAKDHAAIFADLKTFVEGEVDRAADAARSHGFGKQDDVIAALDERFHALKGMGRIRWRYADWIRQSPRLRWVPASEIAERQNAVEQANALREQRLAALLREREEDQRSLPAHRIAQKLCAAAGLQLERLHPFGGPFSLGCFGIEVTQKYGYRVPVDTSEGKLYLFFLERYGRSGKPAAILAFLGGIAATATITRAEYERIVPVEDRPQPD